MWPLTSQRKRRTCGPEDFQSSAKTDFFNTIQPEADSEMAGMQAGKGADRQLLNSLLLDDADPINGRVEPNRVRSGYSRSDRRFQQSTIVECLHRRAKNAGRGAKGRVTTNLLQQIHPKIKTGAQIND